MWHSMANVRDRKRVLSIHSVPKLVGDGKGGWYA